MNTLLISYDLRAPHKDYQNLWDYLKSFTDWARPLESVWLVKTSYSAEQVRDSIKDYHADSNDKIFVANVTKDAAAWNNLSTDVSQWIKTNL